MAMDVVDRAIALGKLKKEKCITADVKIHGYTPKMQIGPLALYGADAAGIQELMKVEPELRIQVHQEYSYVKAEVVWMVRNEMARNVEDVISRRMRLLFLDAKAALKIAPAVAGIMANELGRDDEWIDAQISSFTSLVKQYLLLSDDDEIGHYSMKINLTET
jgi:glycerol-3-phosphate dehydrogenase